MNAKLKKILGHVYYWVGDVISYPMVRYEWGYVLYPVYNWLMLRAIDYNREL